MLRYADVALMLAEVKMHLSENDAVSYLNMVRERAGLDDYSGSSLRDAILRERRVEFAFEGQYWYDLLRLYSRQELLEHRKRRIQISLRKIFCCLSRMMNINWIRQECIKMKDITKNKIV